MFGVWTEWKHDNFPIFKEYIESLNLGYKIEEVSDKKEDENDTLCDNRMNKEDNDVNYVTDRIWRYINSEGFEYDLNYIKNIYLSLKTKPFVILSGISGTGKSKLVRLLAQSLGSTSENGQIHISTSKA